ncbi:MAG: hypothetical protein F6K31_22330, partial [Symploca sp. SIO2G7]|nr:hypothetical protein [Symploca sp. SIO2G7]
SFVISHLSFVICHLSLVICLGSIPFWKKHYPKNYMARVSAILDEQTRQNGMLPFVLVTNIKFG